MDPALAWAIVGLVLVITELVTGTFYLVMLALAAFGAAAAAYFGQAFPVQSVVAALVAAAGCYGVHLYRAKSSEETMPPSDAGVRARAWRAFAIVARAGTRAWRAVKRWSRAPCCTL